MVNIVNSRNFKTIFFTSLCKAYYAIKPRHVTDFKSINL